jgi:hypothetical protein
MNILSSPLIRKISNSGSMMVAANTIAKSIVILLLVPIVISTSSEQHLVIFYALTALYSMQLVADLGVTATCTRFYAYAVGTSNDNANDRSQIHQDKKLSQLKFLLLNSDDAEKELFKGWSFLYFCLALASLFIGFLMFIFWSAQNSQELYSKESLAATWFCIMFIGAVRIWSRQYAAYLCGHNRVAFVERIGTICTFIAIIFAAVTQIIFSNVLLTTLVFYFFSSIDIFILRHSVKKVSSVYGTLFYFDKKVYMTLKPIFNSAWRAGFGQMASLFPIQLTQITVAARELPQAASFLFLIQVIRGISLLSTAPLYAYLPKLASLYKSNNLKDVRIIGEKRALNGALIFLLSLLILFLIVNTLNLYKFDYFPAVPAYLLCIVALPFFCERVAASFLQIYTLTNDVRWHVANGVTTLIAVLAYFIIDNFDSVYSFPFALMAGQLLFYVPYTLRLYFYKLRPRTF